MKGDSSNRCKQSMLKRDNEQSNFHPSQHKLALVSNLINVESESFSCEYDNVVGSSQSDIVLYQKRAQSNLAGVPTIKILSKTSQKINVMVQNPSTLLFHYLFQKDLLAKIRMIEDVVQCYFHLAWIYGHFYIDKQMMKVTTKGEPVSWIHHDFTVNMRQFPIQNTHISETIFIRKLVSTLSQILPFLTEINIETGAELIQILSKMKYRYSNTPTSIVYSPSNIKKNRDKKNYFQSQKSSSRYGGKTQVSQNFKNIVEKQLQKIGHCDNSSRSNSISRVSDQKNRRKKQAYNQSLHVSRVNSPRDFIQLKRYQEEKKQKRLNHQGKNRKLSADYVFLPNYINNVVRKDSNFNKNSFSTKITFSSRGENQQNHEVQEDPSCKKQCKERMSDKKIIISLQTKDSYGNRQRLSGGDLKKFLHESGLKISKIMEEGALDIQLQELFDGNQNKMKRSMKESQLKNQLENLFNSGCEGELEVQELEKDLANILLE